MTKLIVKYLDNKGRYTITEPFEPKDLAGVLKLISHQCNNLKPTYLTITFVRPPISNHI